MESDEQKNGRSVEEAVAVLAEIFVHIIDARQHKEQPNNCSKNESLTDNN